MSRRPERAITRSGLPPVYHLAAGRVSGGGPEYQYMTDREAMLADLLDDALRMADELKDSLIGCHLSAAIDALERRARLGSARGTAIA